MAKNSTISIGFKIDDDKDGFKQLTLDADALRKALATTVVESDALNKKMINLSAITSGLKSCKDSISEIMGAIKTATGESTEFSSAMKATNTMAGKDENGLGKLKDQVTEIARSVPMARDALAQGLYQVISNGVPEDNWISFLTDSSRAAVGGIADLGQTVGVTSTIIKNYGLDWDKAGVIQDKIQLTAKNGVTSFEQMAASLPKVTGNAAALGVTIDELMASFATLTGVSGNTAEVATQLGAIFSALVKPSSQAAAMAEKMGIRFDAAAIKASGGFANFIENLKKDVQSYAQTSGMLEQEIYSTLFGSAESVRALIPLTGELATKFKENVAAMGDSAGTIGQAFNEMASTAEAKSQLMKNAFAGIRDIFTNLVSWAMPGLEFAESTTSFAINILTLKEAIVKLGVATKIGKISTAALSMAVKALGIKSGSTATLVKVLTHAFKGGTMSAIALKVAIRGLLIATGVGVAIWALSEAVSYFTGVSEKSAEASKSEADAHNRAAATIEIYKKKIENAQKTKEGEKKLIDELNSAYGDSMGRYDTLSEWYDTLTAKSKDYCAQLKNESRILRYRDEWAQLDAEKETLEKELSTKSRQNKTVEKKNGSANSYYVTGASRVEIPESSDYALAEKEIKEKERQQKELELKIEKLVEESSMRSTQSVSETTNTVEPKTHKATTAPLAKEIAPEGSIRNVKDRISDIEKKISFSIDPDEIFKLQREKLELQNKLKDLELPVRIAESKEKISDLLEKIDPIKIDFEVDVETLTKEIREIPKGLTAAEKMQQTLTSVSSAASSAGDAFRNMGQAFEIPALDVMGIIAGAIATMIQGYASATAQASALGPWAWAAFGLTGLAQLGTMISGIKGMAAFADGGIVSGPTLGLVGEYAGARSNPEVIAPLNKLRDLIGDTGRQAPVIIGGKIKLSGRDLTLMLENQSKIAGLSGKHYNI